MRVSIDASILRRHIGRLDRNKIARFRRGLGRGDKFPPIDVIEHARGRRYQVSDGYQRFHAHRLEGGKTNEARELTPLSSPQTHIV